MLVVVDAGVFVSAAITPGGAPSRIVATGIEGRFDYLICPTLVKELTGVLTRPKIARLLGENDRLRFLNLVLGAARNVDDPAVVETFTRDPDDDYLVALAIEHRAEWIVTGDRDLHALASRRVPTTTPRAFLGLLGASSGA